MCPNFPWFMSTLVLDFGAQLYEIFKHCAYETKMTRKQLVYFKLHNWGTKHNVKFHCLISNSEGLGMCLYIKGLATIDPHSHKVQTKLFKIPKFGVKRPNSKHDTAIWKWQNFAMDNRRDCFNPWIYKERPQRNVWPFGRYLNQRPDGHTFLC